MRLSDLSDRFQVWSIPTTQERGKGVSWLVKGLLLKAL